MAGTGAFVGREGELSRLRSALAERVRLVLVVGDAGIGKTRFVSEGLAQAAASGMSVISGGCLPLAEKLPLLPVADALDGLSRLDGGALFEAALAAAPDYVRPEVARLLPRLATAGPVATGPVEGWRHERLFAAVVELLDGVARRSPLVLLVEDVHWADGETLDFLTYLVRVGRDDAVSVVVTCRSDEVPLDAEVADWLTHVRRDATVEEIRLGLLSREQAAEQVTAMMGAAAPGELVEEVYARAEGHPFFTEQLVAAAVTDSGQRAQPASLPARLAELLVARVTQYGADARVVLSALAVAGRPLNEALLGEVTGLDPPTVRTAVRDLTAARLLGAPADGGHRPRHALLAEAIAAELLPGEQVSLHERTARALEAAGDGTLAAEAAGHWAAAGRSGEELRTRLTAARAAERVFAYADAATHWQRAIELYQEEPGADLGDGIDLPHLYIRAVDALEVSGDGVRAGAVAEEAYRRFADHPDRATAALMHSRAAYLRLVLDSSAPGLPLMKEALRLFEGTPPSAEHAKAWYWYADLFLAHYEGARPEEILAALNRALEVAEAAGAATLTPQILCLLAGQSFDRGEVEDGFRLLARARSLPEASRDTWAVLTLAIIENVALFSLGRLEEATRVGLRGVEVVRQGGMGSSFHASVLLSNTAELLYVRGRTAEAAALVDPHTMGPIDRDTVFLHACRAQIDLLRGEVDAAVARLAQTKHEASIDMSRELGQQFAEAALWAGRPEEALGEVERLLDRLEGTGRVIECGWFLAVGMRACADLAERARARRDDDAVRAALARADNLASWVKREHDVPFTDHPYMASIPAERATWDAERSRTAGASDPAAWSVAAERWEALDYRHRAGYARWRQAEALLATPHGGSAAASVLSTAAGLAVEHVPLTRAIQDLARRARIDLSEFTQPVPHDEPPNAPAFGLTDRELDVLRLLGQGKTNPEIAAALFISPRTAGVHVTHILRKLDATTRVQAATVAERAGLLAGGQPDTPLAHT
jgi:DNA-binding CsgD family transcriptional regulator/tetratricopeptide (TPR) repeat protein